MHNTTAPKFPIASLNTRVSSYDFDIDFYGSCIAAFVGQISMADADELRGLREDDLCRIANLSYNLGIETERFSAKLGWAKKAYHADFHGFDISRPFKMYVQKPFEQLPIDCDACGYTITDFITEINRQTAVSDSAAMQPHLYAAGTFPMEARYSVTSDKPFDPKLIALQCEDVWGSRFIKSFEYDGSIIEPDEIIWPYEDATELFAKILFN